MKKTVSFQQLLLIGALLIIGVSLIFRLIAIWQIPMIGDEPDDVALLLGDLPDILNFFSAPRTYGFDQSRLPYILSAPLILAFQDHSLIPMRLLFLSFHILFLFYSFKLVQFLTNNKRASWGYLLCLVASCYLASFSIFSITTSDNLYLLFHIMCIYYFLRENRDQQEGGTRTRYLLLILLMALCISSKLFGILLLLSLFVFDLINKGFGRSISLQSIQPVRLLKLGLLFFLGIVTINFLPIPHKARLLTAAIACLGYASLIIYYAVGERNRDFSVGQVFFVEFWAAFALTTFNLTLIFSPVYLNLHNLLKTVTWFRDWSHGLLVERSHYYDMLLIILMKFGLISCLVLLVVLVLLFCILIKNKTRISVNSPFFLFLMVFLIHFTVISLVKHKVTWYPLAIFPFLYLPLVWLYNFVSEHKSRPLDALIAVCFSLILVDNGWRYFRWFPYGHFDGAQYGREYIGWNRAGFISFEIMPELFTYLSSLGRESEDLRVNCQVISVPMYNQWTAILLGETFRRRGKTQFRFSGESWDDSAQAQYNYILTSPVYYPEFEEELRKYGRTKIKTLGLKSIDILSVWK